MRTSDFDYTLPTELIAQEPLPERSDSRMLVVDRAKHTFEHRHFRDLPEYLRPGDLMVLNNTKVIPARLFGNMADTGGRVEVLLIERVGDGEWTAMLKASRSARPGVTFKLGRGRIDACILSVLPESRVVLRLTSDAPIESVLEEEGVPPLPPYIKRDREEDGRRSSDRIRYQTVYARQSGAIAAPTAGLHFSEKVLKEISALGIGMVEVTLHVGPGTFKPVKVENVEDHVVEAERYEIGEAAATAISSAVSAGRRVIAVGSTTVRTLEHVAKEQGRIVTSTGRSALFIYPPFDFKVVGAMLTNLHLPQSSLLMMVAALAGKDLILDAYREAVRLRYRFYSYGDCMLIL